MATSIPERSSATISLLAAMRTSTPGCARVKRASLGTSQSEANDRVVVTVTVRAAGGMRSLARVSCRLSSISRVAA